MAGRIEDYAIVGDMQSVALICTDGSVDWLCLPRFDSEACFAALLGTCDHGQWRVTRDEIKREVCEKGYNAERGAFTQYYGATELDAAVLLISDVGFLAADDPRVVSTMKVLQRDLLQDGFLRRYEQPAGGTSAVDGLASRREPSSPAASGWRTRSS